MNTPKNTYRSLFIITLLLFGVVGKAQNNFKCPWDEIDCRGKCGAFLDKNGDGFCDYGRVSAVEVKDTTPVVVPETTNIVVHIETNPENNDASIDTTIDKHENDTTESKISSVQKENKDHPKIHKTSTPPGRRPYTLILISALVFGLYFLTYFLTKIKALRKYNHKRIWNILLALTFLGSGVLGIILVIQLNYNIWMGIYRDFLYWHVEFGIAMGLIGILHALWHWRYFINIFNNWKNKKVCN